MTEGSKISKLNVARNTTSKIVPPNTFMKNKKLSENNLSLQVERNTHSFKNANTNNKIIRVPTENVHFQRQTKAITKKISLFSKNDAPSTKLGYECMKYKSKENIKSKSNTVNIKKNLHDAVLPHRKRRCITCLHSEKTIDKKLSSANKNNVNPLHSSNSYMFPKDELVNCYEELENSEASPGKAKEHDVHKHAGVECFENFHMEEHTREVEEMKSENHFALVDLHIDITNTQRSNNCLTQTYDEKHEDELNDKMENAFKKYLATEHNYKGIYSNELGSSKWYSSEEISYQLQQKNADNLKQYENSVGSDCSMIQNEFSKSLLQKINPLDEGNYLEIGGKPKLYDFLTNSKLSSLSRAYGIIGITDLANSSGTEVPVQKAEEKTEFDDVLEEEIQNEEFLNLMKEISNDLESDFPFLINEEFGDGMTEIINNVVEKENETICKNGIDNEKMSEVKADNKEMYDMNFKIENEIKVDEKMFEKKIYEKNIKDTDRGTIGNLIDNTNNKTIKNTKIKQPIQNCKKYENWKAEKIGDQKMRDGMEKSKMKRTIEKLLLERRREEFKSKYSSMCKTLTQEQKQENPQKSKQKNFTKDAKLRKESDDIKLKETTSQNRLAHKVPKIKKRNVIPTSVKATEEQKMKKYSEVHFEEQKRDKITEHKREKSIEKHKLSSAHEKMESERKNTESAMETRSPSPTRVKSEQTVLEKTEVAEPVEKVKSNEVKQEEKITEIPTKSKTTERLSIKSEFGNAPLSDETKDGAVEIMSAKNTEIPVPASERSSLERFHADFPITYDKICFTGRVEEAKLITFEIGNLTLYQPYDDQMLLYDIANCTATQAYLMMCNFKFEIEYKKNAEQMSPSGRVPFISSGLCIVAEFESIVSFIQHKKFSCVRIAEYDKSAFRKLTSMVLNTLEMAERCICWLDKETLINYTTQKIGMHHPFPLNHILKWKKKYEERKLLCEEGVQEKSLDMILREIDSCFKNLSHHLGKNNFFFGTATELDALVYGHVYALLSAKQEGPIREIQSILLQYPNLLSFAINFEKFVSLSKLSNIDAPCLGHKTKICDKLTSTPPLSCQ